MITKRHTPKPTARALLDALEPRVLLSVTPNDPDFPSQYALQKIDAPDAWATTTGSNTEVVAVLDTGIDLASHDLAANIWTNPNPNDNPAKFPNDLHGWNFVDNNNDVQDNFVHGTSTAAVIGAVGNNGIGITGIGWNVQILPVEIGTIAGADAATVTAGINYIIGLKKEGVNIVAINASYISFTAPSQAEVNAINSAGQNGMLYVAAAGNSFLNLNNIYPSSFIPSNMIMVAATDESDNLWDQSNYGSKVVALGAPGVDIETLIPGNINISLSGTSYAAPMVTGIAALLKAADPSATVAQLKAAILNGGDLDSSLAGKTITGKRANAEGALNFLLNAPVTPPPPVNHAPTGVLESTTPAITGYAQDPDAPTKAISVQLNLDGKKFKTLTASATRPDLTATLGSPNHGFSVPLSSLPAGVHRLDVYAIDTVTHLPTLIGTAEVSNSFPPTGALSTLTATSLVGYAFDTDQAAKPINIRYTIDNGTPVILPANLKRPDLTAILGSPNHGFAIPLPQLTPGNHTITIDAIDPKSDQLTQLASQTVTVDALAGALTGTVSTLTTTQVAGTVTDSAANTLLKIRIDIDGKKGKLLPSTATNDPTTDTFSVPLKLAKGAHRVDVYAIDPATNLAVLLTRQLVGYTPATGTVTSLISTAVGGTALSPNSKTGKSLLRIDIDGLTGALLTVPTGFVVALPPLPTGNHEIKVTLIDPITLTPTVLTDQTLAFA